MLNNNINKPNSEDQIVDQLKESSYESEAVQTAKNGREKVNLALSSNVEEQKEYKPISYAYELIEEDKFQDLIQIFDQFNPEDHNKIAHRIFKTGYHDFVFENLEKFRNLDRIIAKKLIREDRDFGLNFLGNIDSFNKSILDKKMAMLIVNKRNYKLFFKAVEQFHGLDDEFILKILSFCDTRRKLKNFIKGIESASRESIKCFDCNSELVKCINDIYIYIDIDDPDTFEDESYEIPEHFYKLMNKLKKDLTIK